MTEEVITPSRIGSNNFVMDVGLSNRRLFTAVSDAPMSRYIVVVADFVDLTVVIGVGEHRKEELGLLLERMCFKLLETRHSLLKLNPKPRDCVVSSSVVLSCFSALTLPDRRDLFRELRDQ